MVSNIIGKQEMKNLKKKFDKYLIIFLILACILGWGYLLFQFNEKLNLKGEDLFYSIGFGGSFTIIFSSVFLAGISIILFLLLKEIIEKRTFRGLLQELRSLFSMFIIPAAVITPFLVLAMDDYILVTHDEISYSRYWTLGEKEYEWAEDVESITVRYDTNMYFLNFTDGSSAEVWENMWNGTLENIKKIDKVAVENDIPFHVESRPPEAELESLEAEDRLFYEDLYSR